MEIRSNALLFPKTKNAGPIAASTTLTFPRAVTTAVAALTGYSATYENHSDHHLGRLDINLDTAIDTADPRVIRVEGGFALRDFSGTFDDAYSGTVTFAVFADLVPATGGSGTPRTDLVITDAEITQAVQHFRSALHLDSANVFPDNSIRLCEDKATGIRLWVDYDRNSGLTPINTLSGTLMVTGPAGSATLLPLNSIVAKYESQVSRANASETLNFIIPEGLCRGMVTISARVFAQGNAAEFSDFFQRTLVFEPMTPIRLFAVGINYTGPDTIPGMPTGAPQPADFVTLFTTTELLYPIPLVMQTGFMTMVYNEEIKSDISKGCDKFSDLRDEIKDLRGDSTDVFFGLLNTGVDRGTVGGCGGDGGACVGTIGRPGTAAHELGHVFGRQHAPCDNVTRCKRPKDTDDDYPNYSGFDSDSIGEFGFDTTTGAVLNPGNAHDIMGYSDNDWISPYNYKALMTRIPVDNGGIADLAAAAGEDGRALRASIRRPIVVREEVPALRPHLFTRFAINRDRSVEWQTAFHFATQPQDVLGRPTQFVIEQRDAMGRILLAEYLYEQRSGCGCSGDTCLWPKRFRQDIPFDPQAKKLVILECDKEIFATDIPDAPKLQLTCKGGDDAETATVACTWSAGGEGVRGLWYLLQWRDRRGVWRGVTPRTQKTEWDVPKSLWKREKEVALRVLASSGIATGIAECSFALAPRRDRTKGPREATLHLLGAEPASAASAALPPMVRVAVRSDDGTTSVAGDVTWHGANGGLLGRGRSLPLNVLPVGVHAVTAYVADTGEGSGTATWMFERTRDGRYFWHRGTITYPEPDCQPGGITATRERTRND